MEKTKLQSRIFYVLVLEILYRHKSYMLLNKSIHFMYRQMRLTAINYRTMQEMEMEMISDQYEKIKDKEFLSVSEIAFFAYSGDVRSPFPVIPVHFFSSLFLADVKLILIRV